MKKTLISVLFLLVWVGNSYAGSVNKLMLPEEEYNYYGPVSREMVELESRANQSLFEMMREWDRYFLRNARTRSGNHQIMSYPLIISKFFIIRRNRKVVKNSRRLIIIR